MPFIKVTEWSEPCEGFVPFRIVLRQMDNGWFATHMQRSDNMVTLSGVYKPKLEEGLANFAARAEKHGLKEADAIAASAE